MATEERLRLPGFGLPLNDMPEWSSKRKCHRFAHAICDFLPNEGVTLRERAMLEFMNQITDKPRWTEKIYDEQIVGKWRKEACGTAKQQRFSHAHLSVKCFDYCIEELRDKATYFQAHGLIHVVDVAATVVKADLAEYDGFCIELSKAVHPLENIPESHKDWHPGSDGLVLDLVHPSLFPLQYGKSRVLPCGKVPLNHCGQQIGCGETCPAPEFLSYSPNFRREITFDAVNLKPWGSFQWLPSDVRLSDDGAKLESYINNLNPDRHQDLYALMEKAVDKALPLWNECLSWSHNRVRIKPNVATVSSRNYRIPERTLRDLRASQDASSELEMDDDELDENNSDDNEKYIGEEKNERRHWNARWFRDNPGKREIFQPDPTKAFVPFAGEIKQQNLRRINLREDFPDGIQVIFKLANIHLTPEKPRYEGSAWHVEGALNEHICATALFYYGQENISDSFLEFRQEVDALEMCGKAFQHEWIAAEDLYGVKIDDAAQQDLGKVLTRKGRILAFPNLIQHRVRPFGLADPSKPGHRKILAMFLVDPHIRILPTSNVPPQRRDWWAEEIRKADPFAELPIEIFDRIVDEVEDFPIGWAEACEMREALMAERGRARDEFEQGLDRDHFFFCEH